MSEDLIGATGVHENQMTRTLGPGSLVLLGLGGVIGAGVFVSVGIAAHDKAGPAIIVSFLVAAAACIAVALCFCECASRVPVAGSTYAYGRAAGGELCGWLSGWNLVTCYFLAGAAVAQGWSGYFQSLLGALGFAWPALFSSAPIDLNPATGKIMLSGAVLNLPALMILAIVTAIAYRGIRLSMRINNILLVIKLSALLVVVAVGLAHFKASNWIPFAPFGWGGISLSSVLTGASGQTAAGMLAGSAMVFFAFGGFEMLSAYSHECKQPQRDVPRGVIATICAITLVYVAVAVALTGMAPSSQISISAPISDAFKSIHLGWAQLLVAVGAVIGMGSVLLVLIMSLPRVLYGIAKDGRLPSWLCAMHPKFQTPSRSILLVGTVAIAASSLLPLRIVMDFVMTCTLAGYISVCIFVLLLRRDAEISAPEFCIPGGPVIPVIGVLVCLMLIMAVPIANLASLGIWLALGGIAFTASRFRRTTENKSGNSVLRPEAGP